MNLKELAKAKRTVRYTASRIEVFSFERTARGRKIHSYGLTVVYPDGSQKIYYSLDSVESDSKRSFVVICDEVDNLGFAGTYFFNREDAEMAVGQAEMMLGRELEHSVQFRAEYPNSDFKAWSQAGW